jgi:tRNA1(Val) A37 N6-methylase TrmN6
LPPDPLKAAARFETRGGLGDWVRALAALAPRIALVLPARREAELRELLACHGRPPRRLCRLRTARGRDLVLVEGEEGAAEPLLEELQLQLPGGEHHPRVRRWYQWLGAPLRPGAG